jgi:uncharacterized protein
VDSRAYRTSKEGVNFQVRLTPKGGRDAMEGWAESSDGSVHLKARVRAAPENGKANTALIALLADVLDVPKSAVRIASGASGRLKRIEIAGNGAALAARLDRLGKAS